MKIYVLQGKHDAGKSLTLATLFTKYAENMNILYSYNGDDVAAIEKQIEKKYQAIRVGKKCASPFVKSVVEFNGIRIGLHTSGDNKETAETSIKLFNGEMSENIPCDIGFCAARTKGITVETFKKFRAQGNELIFVKQHFIPQGEDFNKNYQVIKKANIEKAEYLLTLLYDFFSIK